MFCMRVPEMLQEVPRINLTTTKTAPRTECSTKFFVLEKQLEVASGEVGVQLREVQLQGRAKNLKVHLERMSENRASGCISELGEVIVDEECKLGEDGAHMWLMRRPKAGASNIAQCTCGLKPFCIGCDRVPLSTVSGANVPEESGRASGLMAT